MYGTSPVWTVLNPIFCKTPISLEQVVVVVSMSPVMVLVHSIALGLTAVSLTDKVDGDEHVTSDAASEPE